MKILNISLDRSLFSEGSKSESRLKQQAALVSEMHVVIYTPTGFKKRQIGNLFIYPTNSLNKATFIGSAFKVCKSIIKSGVKFDLVTTQDSFETGCVGVNLKKSFGLKLHIQCHGDLFRTPYWRNESFLNKARWYMGRRNLRLANRIRTVNKKCADGLISDFGIDKRKIDTFPISVDVSRFENYKVNPEFKKRFSGKFVVLTVCRLSKEKNLEMLLQAFKKVLEKRSDALLVIVGDGDERVILEAMVDKMRLSESVVFEGWVDDAAAYYKIADVFALTSNHEGFGRTILETNACGTRCVMTDVGLAGEWFIDGVHGSVVDVGDVDGFAREVMNDFEVKKIEVLGGGFGVYLESWKNTIKNRMLFMTQSIDKKDPLLAIYCKWIDAIDKECMDFRAIGLRVGEYNGAAKVASLEKEKGISKFLQVCNFIKHIIRFRNDYDTIFIHMTPIWCIFAYPFKIIFKKRMILWFAHYQLSPLLRIAERMCDKVVSSRPGAYPRKSAKLEILSQGIDVDSFKKRPSREILRAVAVGRISAIKDCMMILEGCAKSESLKSLDFIGPYSKDDQYYKSVKFAADNCDNLDINFLGAMDYDVLADKLSEYDLYINATCRGSYDKTYLEAVSAKIPSIALNDSYSDIMGIHVDKLLFNDLESMSDIIKTLNELPSKDIDSITDALSKNIKSMHSLERLAKLIGRL